MEKRNSFMTPLSLSLFLLLIIIAALQLEAYVPMKTFHYVNEEKTWSDARQYCKEKFTDLASGGDHREDLLFVMSKAKSAWMGLYRDPGDISAWRWTGGDASLDTNWATGELEIQNCTYFKIKNDDKMWMNYKCSYKAWFYCSNGDSVLHETKRMRWFDAQESCNKKSMVLATVTQSNQHEFTSGGWIGLHLPPNTPGSYTSKDVWKWTGTDSDYRKWAPGQPDLKNCGFLSGRDDKWYNAPCSAELPFICVVDNVILVKENKTWEEALEHCRAIGSDSSQHNHYRDHQYDLVSLQSEDDHRYARDKIQEATTNEVWTSLRFLAGQWLWVDGEPQQYKTLPPCPAWGRHCGTLPKDHSTQWQIRDCMERRNFLCIKSPAKQGMTPNDKW